MAPRSARGPPKAVHFTFSAARLEPTNAFACRFSSSWNQWVLGRRLEQRWSKRLAVKAAHFMPPDEHDSLLWLLVSIHISALYGVSRAQRRARTLPSLKHLVSFAVLSSGYQHQVGAVMIGAPGFSVLTPRNLTLAA